MVPEYSCSTWPIRPSSSLTPWRLEGTPTSLPVIPPKAEAPEVGVREQSAECHRPAIWRALSTRIAERLALGRCAPVPTPVAISKTAKNILARQAQAASCAIQTTCLHSAPAVAGSLSDELGAEVLAGDKYAHSGPKALGDRPECLLLMAGLHGSHRAWQIQSDAGS